MIATMSKEHGFRFVAVHLIDVTYLYDRYRFLSGMTLSLSSSMGVEIPFINLITKVDLLKRMGRPDMNLMFYNGTTSGLKYLFFGEYEESKTVKRLSAQGTTFSQKYSTLTKNVCELLENYQKVSFTLLDCTNQMSLTHAVYKIDKANSYFDQPQRAENPKETHLDYEAIE